LCSCWKALISAIGFGALLVFDGARKVHHHPFLPSTLSSFFNLQKKKKKSFREPEGSIGSEFNFPRAIDWAALSLSFVKKRTDKRILYYLLQLDKHPTSLRRNQAESAFSMSFDEGLLLLLLSLSSY